MRREKFKVLWKRTVTRWPAAPHRPQQGLLRAPWPVSGTKRGREVDVRPDYLKCPVGSHMIYFRDSGDQIEVIRVLHQRQDANLNL